MGYTAFDLSTKKIVVTGGNAGIGLGMARALVQAGASVSIWGRRSDKNAAAIADLTSGGGTAISQLVDVSDQQAVEDAMADAVEQLGGLDAVFANAGSSTDAQSFLDISDEDYRKVLGVNLDGVVYSLRSAIKQMIPRGCGGSLVIVSSLGATQGMPAQQHYAASKGGVISVMNSCAVEFARNNIRCNAILPGFIDTDLTSGYLHSDVMSEKVLKRVPLRRWGQSEDFGGIAVYLASDASSYQTGSVTTIDGGFSVF